MFEAFEKIVDQTKTGLFTEELGEELKPVEYSFYYAIKVILFRSNISKWCNAQHLFSSFPMDSMDEEVIINKHIRPGLEVGVKHYNSGALNERYLDLITIYRDEIAALFLLSCRKEQSVDDIYNKLGAFARRLSELGQFNKLAANASGPWLIKNLKIQVRQVESKTEVI